MTYVSTPRHRERGSTPTNAVLYKYHTVAGVTSLYDSYLCNPLTADNEVIDDWVTPGWRSAVAEGFIINNPCSYSHITHQSGGGTYVAVKGDETIYTSGGSLTTYQATAGGITFLPLVVSLTEELTDVKSRCIANIDRSAYDFAEDLLEVRETISFVNATLRRILSLVDNLHREIRRFELDPGKLIDAYLEFRFALMPLVRSIYNAFLALTIEEDAPRKRLVARARNQKSGSGSDYATKNWGSAVDTFYRTSRYSATVRAGILYEVGTPTNDWRRLLGLRDKDLELAVWKVATLSFMLDRLFNVSTMIKGLLNLADPSIRILAAWTTTKTNVESTLCFLSQEHTDGWSVSVSGDTVYHRDGSYTRVVWTPTVLDTVPNLTPGRLVESVTNCLDLLALIAQRLSGVPNLLSKR